MILDEPTNDLDIRTLQILEDYLDSFQGVVVTVSHDRYFLDRVARRIFAFEEDGTLRQYEGGYTDYENRKREEGDADRENRKREESGAGRESRKRGEGDWTGQAVAADAVRPAGADAGQGTGSAATGGTDARSTWTHEKKLKFTYNEQKEYDAIDSVISALEQEIADIDADMARNATNSARLTELSGLKQQKEAELEEKMDRWVYLNELAERIAAQ